MKSTFVKALIFSVCVTILYVGLKLVAGIIATKNHVPDLMNSYIAADELQQSVEFGMMSGTVSMLIEMLVVLCAGLAVFYLVHFLRDKLK